MQDFFSKRNALFACLDDASKELVGTGLDQSSSPKSSALTTDNVGKAQMHYRRGGSKSVVASPSERSLARMRGKESIFKKPELPIARCLKPRRAPDYQLNPHKWKKYSLEDVDISDHTNTSAAFAFLKQIDAQHEEAGADFDGAEGEHGGSGEHKIEFKKSSKIRRHLKVLEEHDLPDVEIDKPKLKGSKVVMPEYVVGGQKKEKKQRKAINLQRAAGTLTLSHLQQECEDDGDDLDI